MFLEKILMNIVCLISTSAFSKIMQHTSLRDHPKSDMSDKKKKKEILSFYVRTLIRMKEVWSLIPHIQMYPPHLHALFVIYIHNVQFQILSWGMFISTWVWDNLIQKYEMCSGHPHPCPLTLQSISFCIPCPTFWMVPNPLQFDL